MPATGARPSPTACPATPPSPPSQAPRSALLRVAVPPATRAAQKRQTPILISHPAFPARRGPSAALQTLQAANNARLERSAALALPRVLRAPQGPTAAAEFPPRAPRGATGPARAQAPSQTVSNALLGRTTLPPAPHPALRALRALPAPFPVTWALPHASSAPRAHSRSLRAPPATPLALLAERGRTVACPGRRFVGGRALKAPTASSTAALAPRRRALLVPRAAFQTLRVARSAPLAPRGPMQISLARCPVIRAPQGSHPRRLAPPAPPRA